MKVSMILAMDENKGIGINNKLPWSLSDDLKRFRSLTLGHHMIMGRVTYESIGRPLPGRTNVILTKNKTYQAPGCVILHHPEDALQFARENGETEVFIIGGAEICEAYMPVTDRIYLTVVHTQCDADTYFSSYQENDWVEITSEFIPADGLNQYPSTYKILDRRI